MGGDRARAHLRPLAHGERQTRMATNVSPSISPDGRHIVFFSSRDLFSIDLYLAETATGRIVRKLVDTALSAHFTSLQFIGSAGSWSPDSRQFVVGGVHAGKAVLAILDIADGDVAREIEVPRSRRDSQSDMVARRKVDRVFGNRRRRFRSVHLRPGSRSGQTDDERSVRGSAAGVVAGWRHASRSSPIGSPPTQALLNAGDYRLAVLDVASGRISPISTFAQGKNINPQWTPTAATCSSCPIRTASATSIGSRCNPAAMAQVTNIDSGISGITALSPSISSAIDSRTLAVSAYEDGSHHIYMHRLGRSSSPAHRSPRPSSGCRRRRCRRLSASR